MARHPLRTAAVCAAASLALVLAGCVEDDGAADQEGTITPTTGVAEEDNGPEPFKVETVAPTQTTELDGEIVEDPAMPISYKWQGTKPAPGGGTIVTVAVINTSDTTMPPEALGEPTLTYAGGQSAQRLSAENAGLEFDGLDMPLGRGATMNVRYVFDVSSGYLYNATFHIGNVEFTGYLNK